MHGPRGLLPPSERPIAGPRATQPNEVEQRHHRADEAVLFEESPEVVALQLRGALDELGEMVGAIYTDDLLDRIFSRFCIGK